MPASGCDSPRAVEPLQRWLSREPEDAEARHLLADYYLGRGQDAEAREQLEILIRQTPNDVVALNNLAWLLREHRQGPRGAAGRAGERDRAGQSGRSRYTGNDTAWPTARSPRRWQC